MANKTTKTMDKVDKTLNRAPDKGSSLQETDDWLRRLIKDMPPPKGEVASFIEEGALYKDKLRQGFDKWRKRFIRGAVPMLVFAIVLGNFAIPYSGKPRIIERKSEVFIEDVAVNKEPVTIHEVFPTPISLQAPRQKAAFELFNITHPFIRAKGGVWTKADGLFQEGIESSVDGFIRLTDLRQASDTNFVMNNGLVLNEGDQIRLFDLINMRYYDTMVADVSGRTVRFLPNPADMAKSDLSSDLAIKQMGQLLGSNK